MSPDELAPVLRRIDPDIAEDAIAAVSGLFVRQAMHKGRPLLRQGELWRDALVVASGLLRLHFTSREGADHNKNFYAAGALVCPLTPAMWSAPSLFGIGCAVSGECWRADASLLRERLQAGGHWERLQRLLLQGLLTAKLQREHDLLALDGRGRYEAFCRRAPDVAGLVPLGQLASHLGLTDVSLSRIRRRVRQAG